MNPGPSRRALAYPHDWSDMFRSTLTDSMLQVFHPDLFEDGALTRQVIGADANLVFSPIARTTFGIKYVCARSELENDVEGILHRGQASFKYVF